jgi:hypothetical protein
MKWLLFLSIVLSCDHVLGYYVHYPVTFYIDNNSVLLYKVINWWYDCLPEESDQLCGRLLKYQIMDHAKVEYNEAEMILKLGIKGGFTDQLIIFKQCEGCIGPSYLKCTRLNKKYFGNGVAINISKDFSTESTLRIKNVDKKHGQLIMSLEHDIVFESEGAIGGLLNGKIALHQAGTFLRNCPEVSDDRSKNFPITFKIINSHTKEVLAEYTAILEN